LVAGGGRPKQLAAGWFVEPTVFADVDDAIRLANDSDFGLGGSVWTSDVERGRGVARRVHTGMIGVNRYMPDSAHRSAASRRAASAVSWARTP
jgi:acyl-CoA reductase-like NAD-dependent aldehyde dehydrogenase